MEEAAEDERSISLRNSSYWFRRIASQRRVDLEHEASLRKDDPEVKTECEVVYEHQRSHFLLGWGSKGHLFPMDPKKYTDEGYKRSFGMFPTVRLPVHNAASDGVWEWASSWHIDFNSWPCDADGWTYGGSFSSIKQGQGQATPIGGGVRRRRWLRLRRFAPMHARARRDALPIDDSHLDSVRGYLNKMGHRRYVSLQEQSPCW